MREFDKQVIMGVPDSLGMIERQAESGVAYTGVDDNENIIMIGGVAIIWEGVGSGWVLTSELMLKYKVWAHRAIKRVLDSAEEKYNLHRIEAVILKDHMVSMKWAERLGFEKEGLLRKYDSNKQDHWIFARVK